jgi:RimJ/RimL family protein N-acetyltransferase
MNKGAVRCYQKAGFSIEGYLKDNTRLVDKWEDDVIMAALAPTEAKYIDMSDRNTK